MITPYRPDDIKPYKPTVLDIETSSIGDAIGIGFAYENIFGQVMYSRFNNWYDWLKHYYALIKAHKNNKHMIKKLSSIYAHNGANFDWLSLIVFLKGRDEIKQLKYIMSGSIGIGVQLQIKSKLRITLMDSNRLMPGKLEKLAIDMGTNTKKHSVPKHYYSRMEDFRRDRPSDFWEYLHDDVIALQQVIHTFWKMIYELEGSIGYLPMTLPSLALKVFRKRMGDEDVIYVPWNSKVKAFTRRAYTGGRVECYKPGEYQHINIYDVNSMYPYVMASNIVPSSHRCAWTLEWHSDRCGFYDVDFVQTDKSIPPLLRDEETGKLVYEGSGVYATCELVKLQAIGGTFDIHEGLVFQKSTLLFKDFVERYYGLRLEAQMHGNDALSYICKILLNSLYGKFGQRGTKTDIRDLNVKEMRELTDKGARVTAAGDYMIVQEYAEVEHEFVAIAAYITSYARVVLYDHILEAGDDYVYSDTDSVHTTGTLPETQGLGGLKLEDSGQGVYIGKKMYAIKNTKGQKVKAKGIGRMHIDIKPSYALFSMLSRGKIPDYNMRFLSFPTVREVLTKASEPCKIVERHRKVRVT